MQTQPITEEDIAQFLIHTPDFFERHADLLGAVQLTSPHGGRAVSLQERQAEMLREKIKVLELRLMEMMRHGNENMLIADKLLRWSRQLFMVARPVDLPAVLVSEMKAQFSVPQAALKLWDVAEVYADPQLAEQLLGWRAELDVDAMCRDAWRWQSMNPNGYRDAED